MSRSSTSRMTLHEVSGANLLYVLDRARAPDREELLALQRGDNWAELIDDLLRSPGLRFCFGAGKPAICLGGCELHPGVWQAWSFATEDFSKIVRPVTRFAKDVMLPAFIRMGMHRGQAIASVDNRMAHKWLRLLGAREEATLKAYGRDGQDFVMFRWDANVPTT